jgi:NAD(P)-dependent dehydrogenase (short-subunit alcohol dehydrogenase family)
MLSGKKIAVSGALGGIGLPLLKHLSSLGAQLIAIDIAPQVQGEKVLAQNQLSNLAYHQLDITDEAAVQTFGKEQVDSNSPSALVNLAAVVTSGDLVTQSKEALTRGFEVNVVGQILLTNIFVNHWIKNKTPGNIVFTSSWIDHIPWPGVTPYAASKAAIVAIARGYARENAKYGIRANIISPGIVDVGMAAKQWRDEPDYQLRAKRAIPLGSLQDAMSVAQGIAFLLSDNSTYMSGSNLLIDGGASLYPLDPEEV